MSAKQGAALQSYNNELVKGLEELCERRSKLQADIQQVRHAEALTLETTRDTLLIQVSTLTA